MKQKWTFETLALADKSTLEGIMNQGQAPRPENLEGFVYCGWNHDAIGKLTGKKFKKGFCKKDGMIYGYNETVAQDHDGFSGAWKMKSSQRGPCHMGYFKVFPVIECQPSYHSYPNSVVFDYRISDNKWHLSFFRLIRDFVVLPNKDDHSLMLGKAYLQFGGKPRIACCYFILGRPESIRFMPTHLQQ